LRKTPLLGNYAEHDIALLAELSLHGRFYEVPEFLFLHREHRHRSIRVYDFRNPHKAIVWYDPTKTGKVIFPAWRLFTEIVLGITRAPLSRQERIRCYIEVFRWLKHRMHELLRDLIVAGGYVPGMGALFKLTYKKFFDLEEIWLKQLRRARKDVKSAIGEEDTFVLVDQGTFGVDVFAGWRTIPFLERGGRYWGPPSDDDTAIRELERLRQLGANFFVLAWPAFWWCDYYSRFYSYLRAKYRCVLENDRVVVFNLRQRIQMQENL
jgi:hypothetical protein